MVFCPRRQGFHDLEMQGHGIKSQFTSVVGSTASGALTPVQMIFQSKTDRACPNNMKYTASSVKPAPGGKKREREEAKRKEQEGEPRAGKSTSAFIPDFSKMADAYKFRGICSIAVTHDHWADVNTSKSCVEDVLVPYYRKVCAAKGLKEGEQRCILLPVVDCWWGWLDPEFREWLKLNHPYVLLLFVPASCTPIGQPIDAGIIAMIKGSLRFTLRKLCFNLHAGLI